MTSRSRELVAEYLRAARPRAPPLTLDELLARAATSARGAAQPPTAAATTTTTKTHAVVGTSVDADDAAVVAVTRGIRVPALERSDADTVAVLALETLIEFELPDVDVDANDTVPSLTADERARVDAAVAATPSLALVSGWLAREPASALVHYMLTGSTPVPRAVGYFAASAFAAADAARTRLLIGLFAEEAVGADDVQLLAEALRRAPTPRRASLTALSYARALAADAARVLRFLITTRAFDEEAAGVQLAREAFMHGTYAASPNVVRYLATEAPERLADARAMLAGSSVYRAIAAGTGFDEYGARVLLASAHGLVHARAPFEHVRFADADDDDRTSAIGRVAALVRAAYGEAVRVAYNAIDIGSGDIGTRVADVLVDLGERSFPDPTTIADVDVEDESSIDVHVVGVRVGSVFVEPGTTAGAFRSFFNGAFAPVFVPGAVDQAAELAVAVVRSALPFDVMLDENERAFAPWRASLDDFVRTVVGVDEYDRAWAAQRRAVVVVEEETAKRTRTDARACTSAAGAGERLVHEYVPADVDASLDIEHRVLERADGMRLLHIRTRAPGAIAHVQFDIETGDDDERRAEREAAHLIEHLVASRLRSRSAPDATVEYKREAEARGIESNASTSAVRTSYYMTGPESELERMIELQLGAVIDFARFYDASGGVDERNGRERLAVERELEAKLDQGGYILYERLMAAAFDGHPRSVSQRVDAHNVLVMPPARVLDYYRRMYVPARTLITVASSRPTSDIVAALAPYTYDAENTHAPVPHPTVPPVTFGRLGRRAVHFESSSARTSSLMLVWPLDGVRRFDEPARHEVSALTSMIAGGFSSRLLARLRTRDGLVYSVSAEPSLDEHSGRMSFFTCTTNVARGTEARVVRDIVEELAALGTAERAPTAAELETYRRRVRIAREHELLNREPAKYVDAYAEEALFRSHISHLDAEYAHALALTAEALRARAAEHFSRSSPLLVLYASAENRDADINAVLQ
jgi:predicted Zn-dependent peptidase